VGRKFKPQAARVLDEGNVLVRQSQDRDLGEVDLLLAGHHQQQIKRPLETLDIDHEGALAGRQFRSEFGVKLHSVSIHNAILAPAAPPRSSSAANWLRAASTSNSPAACRNRNAAAARRPASPASAGASAATARISSSEPL